MRPRVGDLRALLQACDGEPITERVLPGFSVRTAPQVVIVGVMVFVRVDDGGTEPDGRTRTYREAFCYRVDAERL